MTEQSYFWFSKEDLDAIDNYLIAHPSSQHMFTDEKGRIYPYHIKEASGFTGANIDWQFYRSELLDRYRTHPYCDIGWDDGRRTEYLRFLSNDPKKPPEARIDFISKPFVNTRHTIHTNETLLMIDPEDLIWLPPSEKGYFESFKVPKGQVEIPSIK